LNAFVETWRGASSVGRWFLGSPIMALRMGFFAENKRDAHAILAASFDRLLAKCQISVSVTGSPPEPGRGAVVCHNETSMVDVAVFPKAVLPHVDRLGAAELYGRIPLAAAAARKCGIHLVPRGNRPATDRIMAEIVPYLQAGERIAWGGEGRLSGQDGVTRFKIGASLLAIRAGVPIIPVAMYGGHQIMRLGSYRARPGTVHVRFGAPIDTTGFNETTARDLADHTQNTVAAMYAQLKAAAARDTGPKAG
jgi:1-acyl-sn-glycerol-3-phosphate acyltransferase